ncbi:hypothetical protein [Cellulomonas sp. HD19AZ1]|jgi:hypothetical protein|uniref:hypothetical protein n=1 Tax=Cellulomonas sp. HD19AZ1 TaxID=2559593 RepID=UPI001431D46E|nr:hypothetical protein [Cellulomonas sp. HD19AZ1]
MRGIRLLVVCALAGISAVPLGHDTTPVTRLLMLVGASLLLVMVLVVVVGSTMARTELREARRELAEIEGADRSVVR